MDRLLAASFLIVLLSSSLSGQETERLDAWVALTDKGITSVEARQAAYRNLEATFDRRALARRRLRRRSRRVRRTSRAVRVLR